MRSNFGKKSKKFFALILSTLFTIIALKSVVRAIEADVASNWKSIALSDSNNAAITAVNVSDTSFPCGSIQGRIDRGEHAKLLAIANDGYFEYQMWEFQTEYSPILISVTQTNIDRSVCTGLIISGYEPPDTPITESLPLPIAREITVGALQTRIEEEGGLEAFQASITDSFYTNAHGYSTDSNGNAIADEQFSVDSVTKWALDQLGIVLPEGRYYIVDIDDKYDGY